jgi:hypothetical protein
MKENLEMNDGWLVNNDLVVDKFRASEMEMSDKEAAQTSSTSAATQIWSIRMWRLG